MVSIMLIRIATEADVKAIAEVHTRSWQAIYRGHFPDEYLDNIDVDQRARNWREVANEGIGDLAVLDGDDGICGFLHLAPSRDSDAKAALEVTAIYLSPGIWRQGQGQRLMSWALQRSRERGFRRVTLWVLDSNQQARNFYETVGFRWDGTSKTAKLENGFEFTELRFANEL